MFEDLREPDYLRWKAQLPKLCEAPALTRARAYGASIAGRAQEQRRVEHALAGPAPPGLYSFRAFWSGRDPYTATWLESLGVHPLGAAHEPPQSGAELLAFGSLRLRLEGGLFLDEQERSWGEHLLGALKRLLQNRAQEVEQERGYEILWIEEAISAFWSG